MPDSAYFRGKGVKVKADMIRRYGKQKGERVFHATAHKQGMTPTERHARAQKHLKHR